MSTVINPGETLTVVTTRRTWRTNIESPLGGSKLLTAFRETIKSAGSEQLSRNQDGAVNRDVASVAAETVTLADGTTVLTAAQIAEGVTAFIEKWDAEDRAAEAARMAALNTPPAS